MLMRHTKRRPSELLRISDEITALDLDLAVSYVLLQWEAKRERDRLDKYYRATAIACSVGFGGGELPDLFEDDEEDEY